MTATTAASAGLSSAAAVQPRRVLVTGAGGYLGRQVVAALAALQRSSPVAVSCVLALDVRDMPAAQRIAGVHYASADIRDPALAEQMHAFGIDTVVHLAAIVTPGRQSDRAFEYQVDVEGTRNVLAACLSAPVQHLVVSSSGAAYGYHADNPPWLDEDHPLRGNEEFAYAWHKRLVEQMLAEHRAHSPQLRQTVLRIGTILGRSVDNQITALFLKPRPLAIAGADSPFVFIWDEDVVAIIVQAVLQHREGIYNVAGDGALTLHEIAARMGKRCRVLPATLLRGALWAGRRLGLTAHGPEQLRFLRYRPVLDNRRLKQQFGYTPKFSSAEAFDRWWAIRQRASEGPAGAAAPPPA